MMQNTKKNWYNIVQINLQGHLSSSLKRPFIFEITLDFIPEKNAVVQQPRDVWMATEPDLYYPLNQREKSLFVCSGPIFGQVTLIK